MELGLSLGHASNPKSKPSGFVRESSSPNKSSTPTALDFCMDLSLASPANTNQQIIPQKSDQDSDDDADDDADQVSEGSDFNRDGSEGAAAAAPVNLSLLPVAPVPRRISPNFLSLPWPSENGGWENRSGLDVNRPAAAEEAPATNGVLGLTMWAADKRRCFEDTEAEKTSSRASDDDENGLNSRKKLRLSKEQSAFLEESFKQHHTLNPKQKLALAKQLNLRPRQVEVWFQNRRARTKLKQTEVDCEYLKRCCETLTEENRRLHKELQELRALKASSSPFYAQLPPTTLTMCPSCERVSTAALAPPPPQPAATSAVTKPIFYTSSAVQTSHPNRPAASS